MPSYTPFSSSAKAKGIEASPRPIDSIPPELLMIIFEEFCDAVRNSTESLLPELLISHVCQYWKSIAINLPSLWTKLSATTAIPPHIVFAYLDRSQQLPLDLEVDLQCEEYETVERQSALDIWKAVLSKAPQWRRLVVQLSAPDATIIMDDIRDLSAPHLEELHITCSTHLTEVDPLFVGGIPSLTSLRLAGIPLQRFTTSLSQLTQLHLTSNCPIPFATFQELMSTMVRLQDLTLRKRVVEGWPLYPSAENIIQLPSLRSFKVSDRRCPVFVPLLSISASTLKTLTLYDLSAHDLPEPFQEAQICDNFPALTNLTLKGKSSFIDNCSFNQLSRVFPTIDHFSLLGVDEEFVRESSRAMHETSIWPKLQTISMTPVVEEDMLYSLISARTKPAVKNPLKTVLVPIDTQFTNLGSISQQLVDEDSYLSPTFSFNDGSSRRCSIDLTAGGGLFLNREASGPSRFPM